MKKLRLAVDKLRVESFRTDAAPPAAGMVRGHDKTADFDTCACSADSTPSAAPRRIPPAAPRPPA
jgi:hypothetical protein